MNEPVKGFEFPCRFPIKVFGREDEAFVSDAREIIERHAGRLSEDRISRRASRNARFLAVTFTIDARSREQLDEIYRELSACDEILMAL